MIETRSLENNANNLATPGKPAIDYRAERWAARGFLWRESALKRVRECGRVPVTTDGSVQVRANGAAVGYAGLSSCGSVWACPVCNAKVQAVRRLEVGVAVASVQGSGGSAVFGAYTLRHHAGQSLASLWPALSYGWESVARDGSVKRLRQSLGFVGTIRAVESTTGSNGWHPHLHPVHLFGGRVSPSDVVRIEKAEFRAWSSAMRRKGLEAPMLAAQDLHLVTGDAGQVLGDYFTKATYEPTAAAVGWEMTSTQTKSRSRAKYSRTPWDLLRESYVDGLADSWGLWQEWEKASKGKKALTWSNGLRRHVGLDHEASDEDIAAAEVGTKEDTGFSITDWSPIQRAPRLGAELLGVVGTGKNWEAGRAFCARHGIATCENEVVVERRTALAIMRPMRQKEFGR